MLVGWANVGSGGQVLGGPFCGSRVANVGSGGSGSGWDH